jgi:hypothetical protein
MVRIYCLANIFATFDRRLCIRKLDETMDARLAIYLHRQSMIKSSVDINCSFRQAMINSPPVEINCSFRLLPYRNLAPIRCNSQQIRTINDKQTIACPAFISILQLIDDNNAYINDKGAFVIEALIEVIN